MHIVQILPELNQGGVERGVVEFSRELVKRGHESTVISAGGTQAEQIVKDGGHHVQLDVCSKSLLTFPSRVRALRRTLAELRPDILHARSRVPAWLAWFANKPLHIPFVTTVHGFNSIGKYSKIMTQGDAVICVSNPVKRYIRENYKTPEGKITVIHRGIDPSEFSPDQLDQNWIREFKKKFDLNEKIIVTSAGRVTELKDYETFIRAIAICVKDIPHIRGLIVGGVRHDKQAYFERLKTLTRALKVEGQIIFAGSHKHMPEIYALSSLLVSSSKKPESFGRTLIEAMAMNTPVISAGHGGALDIVKEGTNGELFTPGASTELAQKILKAQTIPTRELRESTLNDFSLEKMVKSTLKVYESLVHEGSPQ